MNKTEKIECANITTEQAAANSQAVADMYEDGDRRDRMFQKYKSQAIDKDQYDRLKDQDVYKAVSDMFFGAPADQLDRLMDMSPDEIAAARREEARNA